MYCYFKKLTPETIIASDLYISGKRLSFFNEVASLCGTLIIATVLKGKSE